MTDAPQINTTSTSCNCPSSYYTLGNVFAAATGSILGCQTISHVQAILSHIKEPSIAPVVYGIVSGIFLGYAFSPSKKPVVPQPETQPQPASPVPHNQ
jgi:uncharacterized membrane-anchored protein YitT (DUF2179 family)